MTRDLSFAKDHIVFSFAVESLRRQGRAMTVKAIKREYDKIEEMPEKERAEYVNPSVEEDVDEEEDEEEESEETSESSDAEEADEEVEIDATDGARELAGKHNIDLFDVEGSGEDGRIIKSDIEKLIS